MPNTLAHIGAQGFVSRPFLDKSDIKWIYLGCILPDVPWMLQRVIRFAGVDVNAYDLRLYVIIQSSLLFSVLLAAVLSMFSARYWRAFAILSLNALLHLLLDAMQVKWANGVHLFAPFSWKLINFGFFWPENRITYLLTVLGIVFFVITWKKTEGGASDMRLKSPMRYTGFVIIALIYMILPLLILDAPEKANNHFVHTLRDYQNRAGKHIELDRKPFDAHTETISAFGDEPIQVKGVDFKDSAVLSISGNFIAPDTIWVEEYHVHDEVFRDGASYVGLALVLVVWIFGIRANSEPAES
jgi:hypothetical protein